MILKFERLRSWVRGRNHPVLSLRDTTEVKKPPRLYQEGFLLYGGVHRGIFELDCYGITSFGGIKGLFN